MVDRKQKHLTLFQLKISSRDALVSMPVSYAKRPHFDSLGDKLSSLRSKVNYCSLSPGKWRVTVKQV
jgi:hypothetical protein